MSHVIVLCSERDRTGKSTVAAHIVVALMRQGQRVAALDVDIQHRALAQHVARRSMFCTSSGQPFARPAFRLMSSRPDGPEEADAQIDTALAELSEEADWIVVDGPAGDGDLSRAAMRRADSLIAVVNDATVDTDAFGSVDGVPPRLRRAGWLSELVWDLRKRRAARDGGQIDWVVARNRRIDSFIGLAAAPEASFAPLAASVGFRVVSGLGEVVAYRDLFSAGLTAFDVRDLSELLPLTMTYLRVRSETQRFFSDLALRWAGAGATSESAAGAGTG